MLLQADAVESFFRAAASTVYATDADFFCQEVPLLAHSREVGCESKVRRVHVFTRRQERDRHEQHTRNQWCVQADTSEAHPEADGQVGVSTMICHKVTTWSSASGGLTRIMTVLLELGSTGLNFPMLRTLASQVSRMRSM